MRPTLYDDELSADCYKVRLLAHALGVELSLRPVDVAPGREHERPWYRELDALGSVPLLVDGDVVLRDAIAIMTYLAAAYDAGGTWDPRAEPGRLGAVAQWLAFARELAWSAGALRRHDAFGEAVDVASAAARADRLLRVLDEHLWFAEETGRAWLVHGAQPSIADVACFPDIALAEEGGLSLRELPAVRRWTDRVRRIPGFITMPGIFPAAPA